MSSPSMEPRHARHLSKARLEIHHAIQLVAAVGASYGAWLDGDEHTSLLWTAGRTLRGISIPCAQPFHLELEPVALELSIRADAADDGAIFSLIGVTMLDAMRWLRTRVGERGLRPGLLTAPTHADFPASPLAHGATFDPRLRGDRAELTGYFAVSASLLGGLAETSGGQSEPRVWPHHFDIAIRLSAGHSVDGKPASTGLGMSPGDHWYDEPYWYASPWPAEPDAHPLPPLPPNATWHSDGWFGAVLRAARLPEQALAQEAAIRAFLTSSLGASRAMLARASRARAQTVRK
ncbi:MAG: hypothetical protein IPJ34_25955 [Myxococcales bacterium]|nr:hypothetical protein [Myxococcales bacterium]